MHGESINVAVDTALSTAELPVDRNEVLKLASHPEVKNMQINSLKQIEYHFELPLDGPLNGPINEIKSPIIQGYIDLWWEDFLEDTVLDWKTNRKKYTPKANHQLGLYAWALNQITGKERITASLVFLRYGQTNCYEIEQYGLEDMEEASATHHAFLCSSYVHFLYHTSLPSPEISSAVHTYLPPEGSVHRTLNAPDL